MIESESYRLIDKRTTRQKRFHISSLDAAAETFQDLIRKHRSIWNGCHWLLDTL